MSVTTPSAPLSIRSIQTDLYDFALGADYGYDGQRLYNPSLAWSRDPDVIERMLRDPSIAGDMAVYQAEVSGTSFTLQARAKDKYSQKVAEWFEEVFDDLNIYAARLHAARSILTAQEFFYPESNGRQLQTFAGLIGDFWVPTNLKQMDQRRFRSNVNLAPDFETGEVRVAQALSYFEPYVDQARKTIHWKWEKVEDESRLLHFIWDDDESRLGFGRGLMEAIYPWWYYATKAMNSWSNAGERFGEGFVIALIDDARIGNVGRGNPTVQQAYLDQLDKMRARHYMTMSSKDKVEMVEPGQGYKILVELVEFCYRNITRLILGAVMPTGGAGTENSGPKAGSGVQSNSTSTRVQLHQRLLDETFTKQLIRLIWNQNCAEFMKIDPMFLTAKLPRFITTTEGVNDPGKNITVITAALGAKMDLRKDEAYEKLGLTPPTPDDYDTGNVIEGTSPPSPFDSPAFQSFGNEDGNGAEEDRGKPAALMAARFVALGVNPYEAVRMANEALRPAASTAQPPQEIHVPVTVNVPERSVEVNAPITVAAAPTPDVHVNVAPTAVRVDSPVTVQVPERSVHVAAPNVTVAAPPPAVVNVAAPNIRIEPPPPANVTINLPPGETPQRVEKIVDFKRDAKGDIIGAKIA